MRARVISPTNTVHVIKHHNIPQVYVHNDRLKINSEFASLRLKRNYHYLKLGGPFHPVNSFMQGINWLIHVWIFLFVFFCRVYDIGIDVRFGQGRYRDTRIVTLATRYQLENRTQHTLAFSQRHFVREQVCIFLAHFLVIADMEFIDFLLLAACRTPIPSDGTF